MPESGEASWLRVHEGRVQAGAGEYVRRRPFVRFVFPTVDGAYRVFANTATQMEAFERGWVETFGSPEYTRKISFLLQTMDAVLSGEPDEPDAYALP